VQQCNCSRPSCCCCCSLPPCHLCKLRCRASCPPSTRLRPAAFAIKQRIYGNRIVLFAPLYIANYCVNNCRYCAFRQGNKNLEVRRVGESGRAGGVSQVS